MESEKFLPKDERFASLITEFSEEVRDEIEDITSSQGGNLLSVEAEFNNAVSLYAFHQTAQLIAWDIVGHERGDEASYASTYRALVFAYQSVRTITTGEIQIPMYAHLSEYLSASDGFDTFNDEVQGYLSENIAIADYIGEYIDDIDEHRRMHACAELAAGLVFMLSERSLGEAYLEASAGSLSMGDFDQPENEV